jgi:hypothetical protein
MPETKGPVQELLQPLGLAVEPREVGPIPHIIATGVGSLLGYSLMASARLGFIGCAVGSIGGAVLGHVAVTHRIVCAPRRERADRPESPMAVSDRR